MKCKGIHGLKRIRVEVTLMLLFIYAWYFIPSIKLLLYSELIRIDTCRHVRRVSLSAPRAFGFCTFPTLMNRPFKIE